MTFISEELDTAVPVERPRRRGGYEGTGMSDLGLVQLFEVAAMVLVVAVAAVWVAPGQGGLDPGRTWVGVASLLPAALLVRPWRHVPARELSLAFAVVASAVLVASVTPYEWSGGRTPATWAYAAGMYVVVRAFCRTPARRAGVLAAVAVAGLDQFSRAWLPYWGGEDPAIPMIGTFYWHNQFAIYVAACAAVAVAMVLTSTARLRLVGWVVAPFCLVGVVLSTSRATMAIMAVAVITIVAQSALRAQRVHLAVRVTALAGVSCALLFLLTSDLAFRGNGANPFAGLERRNAAQGVASSGGDRIEFWDAAVSVAVDRPLFGTGFGSYAQAAAPYQPAGIVRSPAVHNGFLQAFAEGGLAHGVPVLVAGLAALWVCVGAFRRALADESPERWVLVASSTAGSLLILHGAVDFDFFFPSLLALAGALIAVASAPQTRDEGPDVSPEPARRRRTVPAALLAGLALVGVVATAGGRAAEATTRTLRRSDHLAATEGVRDASQVATSRAGSPFADVRVWLRVLEYSFASDMRPGLLLPEPVVRQALRRTAQVAQVDSRVAMRRAQARYLLGDRRAIGDAREIMAAHQHYRPFLVGMYADMLVRERRRDEATAVLATGVREHAERNQRASEQVWGLVQRLVAIDPGAQAAACAFAEARDVLGDVPDDVRPPTSTCRSGA